MEVEGRRTGFRGKRRGTGEPEREREKERIRRSCGRKKRIEIAQDSRTEMEVRYRNRDFHHRESLPGYGA